MSRLQLYVLGLLTLMLFPIPTLLWYLFYLKKSFHDFLSLPTFQFQPISIGLGFGIGYALIVIFILSKPYFDEMPLKTTRLLKGTKLYWIDALFLSLCAGIGEEYLFRLGIQYYLGPLVTSIIFIALHGYFNLKNMITLSYGLLLLPFILGIAYGLNYFGFWFCVSAHFAYNLILFSDYIRKQSKKINA